MRFGKYDGSKKKRRKFVIYLILILVLFGIWPVFRISAKVNEVRASANELRAAFRDNDIDKLSQKFKDFEKKYNSLQNTSRWIYWAIFIPYVADYRNGLIAGDYMIKAADIAIESITPYANLIGFKKGGSSFTEKSGEDRLQTAVLTLDKMLVRIDDISSNIDKANDSMQKINPSRYPKKFGKTVIRERIANLKASVGGVSSLLVDAKPLVKKLPEIFGKDKEKTYLILFQNDKERRATGGFLTTYSIFKINKGKLKVARTDDVYNLDNSISSHPAAPEEILAYHKGVNRFYVRDSNLSPDFVESIRLFESLYEKSPQAIEYDGIFAVDSKVLVDMLRIYGDTEVQGITFSAKQDDRCDCPQVLYQLFDIVDRPVNYVKENRKGILGELMFALLQKALGFSPSQYWGILAQTMFGNLEKKHILLYFEEKDLQEAAEKINFAGRIRATQDDYLHVNNVNFAGAKSNLFVTETITSKTKTGSGEREVVIEFKNPYPHSDCNLERGGLCLNAQLRNWIRVYVPEGSKLVKFVGSETEVKTFDELGKTVFEGFMRVNPLGKATVTVTYTLPDNLKNDRLMIQKQPGIIDSQQKLVVYVDNHKLYDGAFDKDKVLSP